MPSEREKLERDIDGLKEKIELAWRDMLSKPMTAGERQELRDSIESLIGELNNLQTELDQLPGPGAALRR
jgi:predicted  nucleic acid-binding Zn-ribbon protein